MTTSKDGCCIPDCVGSGRSHKSLHGFPHPEKYSDRFRIWLYAVGGNLLGYSNDYIYRNRRICHNHFEEKYQCRHDRISNIAVPTINMPKPTAMPHFPIVEHQPLKAAKKKDCTSSPKDPVIFEMDSKPIPSPNDEKVKKENMDPTDPVIFEMDSKIPSPINEEVKKENKDLTDPVTYEMDSSPIFSPMPSPCHQELEKENINPTGYIATLHSPSVECSTLQIEASITDPSTFKQGTKKLPVSSLSTCTGETIKTLPSAEYQDKKQFRQSSMTDTEKSLHKKLTSLRRQISKCRLVIKKQREKIKQSKNIFKNPKFLKSMENWTAPAKVITLLQFREGKKMKKGRRFTLEEKLVALALFKQSQIGYKFLRKIFILPSSETLIKLLEVSQLESIENVSTQVESGIGNENFHS